MLPLHPNNEGECQGCRLSRFNSLMNLPTTICLLESQRDPILHVCGGDQVVVGNRTCRLGCVTWSCLVLLAGNQILMFVIVDVVFDCALAERC